MDPAFSSERKAVGFGLLLGVLLSLPAAMALTGWFKIEGWYPNIGGDTVTVNGFRPMQAKTFAGTKTVDIAFVGSSSMYHGINTPYVKRRLSEHLNREAEVFTLAFLAPGYDMLYFVAKDLLDHRRVKMLVVTEEVHREQLSQKPLDPSRWTTFWYCRGENTVALGLQRLWKIIPLYGAAIYDMPRFLLERMRPSLPFNLDDCQSIREVIANYGALRLAWGWGLTPTTFVPYDPQQFTATPSDVIEYSDKTRDKFVFTPVGDYCQYFTRCLARLCQERGTELVVLYVPKLIDVQQSVMLQSWPEDLDPLVKRIGIPGDQLFAAHARDDVQRLFYIDDYHLNQNGENLFTPLITPMLLKFYDASTNRF